MTLPFEIYTDNRPFGSYGQAQRDAAFLTVAGLVRGGQSFAQAEQSAHVDFGSQREAFEGLIRTYNADVAAGKVGQSFGQGSFYSRAEAVSSTYAGWGISPTLGQYSTAQSASLARDYLAAWMGTPGGVSSLQFEYSGGVQNLRVSEPHAYWPDGTVPPNNPSEDGPDANADHYPGGDAEYHGSPAGAAPSAGSMRPPGGASRGAVGGLVLVAVGAAVLFFALRR